MKSRTGYLFVVALLLLSLTPLARRLLVPSWLGLGTLLLFAGVVGALFFLLRSALRRRFDERAVRRELEQCEEAEPEPSAGNLRDLEAQWQKGIDALENSHLKKLGDPLHALPWYLVLGQSASGKTSALRSARLTSPLFSASGGDSAPTATANCRWWFFEKAVFIDTSGRYATAHQDAAVWEEWERFVTLLARHRRHEPLNGVVVTVAADTLLKHGGELAQQAASMRRRLHELMRVFQVRFPVYLLVTKCDRIDGMNPFCALLSEEVLAQPMGMLNEELSHDAVGMTRATMAKVLEQLRLFRLQLLHHPAGQDPGAFALFPENFAALEAPLTRYVAEAFGGNVDHEVPALRGLFFSSSLQEVSAAAGRLAPARTSKKPAAIPGADRAFFLRELFGAVLPRDRSLLAPTARAVRWRSVTARVGVASYVLVVAAFCAVATFSFRNNSAIIRDAAARLSSLRGETGLSRLETLARYREAVLRVEEENHRWHLPRFLLTESVETERVLKQRFCRRFYRDILAAWDGELQRSGQLVGQDSSDDLYGTKLMHLARRLNLLNARLRGEGLGELRKRPLPPPLPAPGALRDRGADSFADLYLSYLDWCADPSAMRDEARLLRARLRDALRKTGGDLRWVSRWVDGKEGLQPVTVADFWGGVRSGGAEPVLRPSFTRAGRERILAIVREVEEAAGAGAVARGTADTKAWLRESTLEAWREFAEAFPCGAKRVQGNSECQRLCSVMGNGVGPYFALLDRLTLEVEPFAHGGQTPPWVKQLFLLQAARAGALQGTDRGNGTVEMVVWDIAKRMQPTGGASDAKPPEALVAAWRDYFAALQEISAASVTPAQAFDLAAQTYGNRQAEGRSPFFDAYRAVSRLRSGVGGASVDFPWQVVSGPVEYLWWYVRNEAAGQLQKQWEEQVVPAAAALPPAQASQALLGPEGAAWKFAKGAAAPFLVQTAHVLRPKVVLGAPAPLDEGFFSFMRSGRAVVDSVLSRESSYTVGVQAFPMEANADAGVQPHASRLDLVCPGNTQSLVNLNYPSAKTLYWTPGSCADVVLRVEVGDLQLVKRYGGAQGFPAFLRDFRDGSRTFASTEFPAEKNTLEKMGIRQVRLNYSFTGSAPVIRYASGVNHAAVPRTVGKVR